MSVFARASKKEAWDHKAHEYFNRKYFALAKQAYSNASLLHEAKVAEAYWLREEAGLYVATIASPARRQAFKAAAEAFGGIASAAGNDESHAYYRIAGECFLEVPDEPRAAEAFYMGCEYTQAIQLYRQVGNFERVAEILVQREREVEPDTAQRVRYASQLFYLISRKFRCVSRNYDVS